MSIGRQIGCKSRFLLETDNWYAIPTMGSLTVGYILLVTKQHYLSLANLDSNLFFEMLNLKKSVEDFLFKKLGMHCIKNFTTFLIQAICLLSCFENVSLLTWVQTIGTGEARAIRIIF